MHDPIIGFIGAGNMAGAIIDGMLAGGFPADRVWVCDPSEEKRQAFDHKGLHATTENEVLVKACDIVVLAVKPQVLKDVVKPVAEAFQSSRPVVVSVVAGVSAESIDRWLGGGFAIVRTMPNTPALVMTGATGLYANDKVQEAEKNAVYNIFSGIGTAVWVSAEDDLHTVTATSGSAPAYFFRFMEAMQKAAEAQGLNPDTARALIAQTALGAARMVKETGDEPAELRRKVTSPKGTTEQAILSFEKDDIDAVVARAMEACHHRSIELSKALAD